MSTTEIDVQRVEEFAGQVAAVIGGGATTAMMVVGDRLGLYGALAGLGPATSQDLASATATDERYVREWLAQQAAVGFVTFDPVDGTFTLPPEHAAVLVEGASPAAMIGAAPIATGMHRGLDQVVDAFRTGAGIPWSEQDPAIFETIERFFGTGYRTNLVSDWIPAVEGAHEALTAGAYVADVGCGRGTPGILLAQAYPESRVVGFDIHEADLEVARQRAADAGVADRVTFEVCSSESYPQDRYDLITFFDAFHDLGDPHAAAVHARSTLADDGILVLVEPRAGDDLASTLATVPVAALNFAASTFLCVASSKSQPGSAALGSQAGEAALREILQGAGFSSVRRAAESPFNMVIEARP